MSSTEEALKAYNLLFNLPRTHYLALSAITLSLLPAAVSTKPFHAAVAWMSPPFLITVLTYVLSRSKILTLRRCFGASVASLLAQVVAYLVLISLVIGLSLKNLASVLPFTSSAAFTSVHLIATKPLAERGRCTLLPAPLSFTLLSTLHAIAYNVELSVAVVYVIISQVTGLVLAHLFLQTIDVMVSDGHREGLKLFKAFANAWLLNDPSQLEVILKQKGEVTHVQVTSLVFRSQRGVEGCFITFDAHPGPFRNVAGSNLPADVVRTIETTLGGVCFVFHSTAMHDRDPASREDAARIVEAALRASVKASKLGESLYTHPVCSREVEPHICCQVIGIPIISMTWREQMAEDLPYALGIELKKLAKNMGFVDALIIDAHNCYLPTKTPSKLSFDEVKLRVARILNEAIKGVVKEVKAAFKTINLPRDLIRSEEIGDAGIKLAFINVGDTSCIYVLVDANNMDPNFHRILLNALLNQRDQRPGFVEVYTTDTHSVVGLRAIKGGYRAFGTECKSESIISLIHEEVRLLRERLTKVDVSVGKEVVEVNVIGNQGLASLLKQLKRGLQIVKWILPMTYLLSAFLPPLFIAILMS